MAVITISRELGSEGDQIAELLCEQLGYCRVDKDVLRQIAQEAGIPPEAILAIEDGVTQRARLTSDEMTALYRKNASAFERRGAIDDATYTRLVKETMERYAQNNNAIIVGRGGQMVLRDWPNALHVRLCAADAVRIGRVAARQSISEAEARKRVEASDERRRQYIRQMFNNADWRSLKHYHLVIDTSRVSVDAAAEIIALAAQDIDRTMAP